MLAISISQCTEDTRSTRSIFAYHLIPFLWARLHLLPISGMQSSLDFKFMHRRRRRRRRRQRRRHSLITQSNCYVCVCVFVVIRVECTACTMAYRAPFHCRCARYRFMAGTLESLTRLTSPGKSSLGSHHCGNET